MYFKGLFFPSAEIFPVYKEVLAPLKTVLEFFKLAEGINAGN